MERVGAKVCVVGGSLLVLWAYYERRRRQRLEDLVQSLREAEQKQLKLRDEERRGRTRAEKQLRETLCKQAAEPEAGANEADAGASGNQDDAESGFLMRPIGTFQSCYRSRCGTPRQGGLVSDCLAVLACSRYLNPAAALEGLADYSHCWVLYVFHENTNLPREAKTVSRRQHKGKQVPPWQGLCMKVAPPRCPELRVGVLACRTPHRPNPLGLSLARVVKVDAARGEVVLAGLDVVDGTPCLDLKPYLPSFEAIADASVPSWVHRSYSEPLMEVIWTASAAGELRRLFAEGGSEDEDDAVAPLCPDPFSDVEALKAALEGTLALDIRSPVQKERHKNPGSIKQATPFFVGDLWFHELHVTYGLIPVPAQPGQAEARVEIQRVEPRSSSSRSGNPKVEKVLFDDKGVACGAMVSDKTNPSAPAFKVKAKKVIYCGGPFTDEMRKISEGDDVKEVVNGSGGTHIVLPSYYCPRDLGMVDMMTSRGSFLFYLPWEGYTLVGTTDVKTKPDLHHEVPEDEIEYLLSEVQKYLTPDLQVRRRDVLSAWYGIRPLCADPNATDQSSISRDHVISHHPTNGITFISGGKWTTWREMAEDCVSQVVERQEELKSKAGPSVSLHTPLVGSGKTQDFPEGYHENLAMKLIQKTDVPQDVATNLVKNYGTRAMEVLRCVNDQELKRSETGLYRHYPRIYEDAAATTGFPYLEAEIKYAVENEYACKAADILARRTRLAFLNANAAQASVPRVVELMGNYLGWDEARRRQETLEAQEVLSKDFVGPVPRGK